MTTTDDVDQRLLWLLHMAGDEWGPLGVALVAARLTDRDTLLERLSPVGDHHNLSLSLMQQRQPWTVEYSKAYSESVELEPHRDMTHAILHLQKAIGVLATICEFADHGRNAESTGRVAQYEFENRLADLVMCALRIASCPPPGYESVDLEDAVVTRTQAVNSQGFEKQPEVELPTLYLNTLYDPPRLEDTVVQVPIALCGRTDKHTPHTFVSDGVRTCNGV